MISKKRISIYKNFVIGWQCIYMMPIWHTIGCLSAYMINTWVAGYADLVVKIFIYLNYIWCRREHGMQLCCVQMTTTRWLRRGRREEVGDPLRWERPASGGGRRERGFSEGRMQPTSSPAASSRGVAWSDLCGESGRCSILWAQWSCIIVLSDSVHALCS